MSAILKAEDILPETFRKPGADIPGKRDDLDYDVGNMEATDNHQVNMEEFQANKEEYLLKVTRDNTQFLINHLFELPTENTDVGPVATLPNRIIRIPREKPIPKKVETKWEKFARKKGIKKHKKERMVYDKNAKEWRPRWGYKKAGTDSMDDWITEDK